MTTLTLIPCAFSPRVENLADFAAGLLAIRKHGIPQIVHLHPEDIAATERIIYPAFITDGITHWPAQPAPPAHSPLATVAANFRLLHSILPGTPCPHCGCLITPDQASSR